MATSVIHITKIVIKTYGFYRIFYHTLARQWKRPKFDPSLR